MYCSFIFVHLLVTFPVQFLESIEYRRVTVLSGHLSTMHCFSCRNTCLTDFEFYKVTHMFIVYLKGNPTESNKARCYNQNDWATSQSAFRENTAMQL